MKSDLLNLCQVTLGTDAEIVNENLIEFNKIYKNVKLFIVCPNKDKEIFIKTLVSKNYEIITEDELISLNEFSLMKASFIHVLLIFINYILIHVTNY